MQAAELTTDTKATTTVIISKVVSCRSSRATEITFLFGGPVSLEYTAIRPLSYRIGGLQLVFMPALTGHYSCTAVVAIAVDAVAVVVVAVVACTVVAVAVVVGAVVAVAVVAIAVVSVVMDLLQCLHLSFMF